MRLLKKIQFGIIALLLSSAVFAGIDDVTLDLQLINPNAQIFIVGDFRNSLETTSYFILFLGNNGPEIRVKLRLDLFYNNERIAWVESAPFDLPESAITPLPPYSNQQLNQGVMIPGASPPYDQIQLGDFEMDLGAVNNLESQILTTGKLPAGVYDFRAAAIEILAGGGEGGRKEDETPNHTLIITNPTTLELFFPGRSVSAMEIEEIATTFPYFQWQSDVNPAAADYKLYVYEKFVGDETVDDVLSHPPVLQIEGYGFNFFQYPTNTDPNLLSGQVVGPIRLLENGKIYYWLVESVVPTASGSFVIRSDVFRFKVSDLAGQDNYAPQIWSLLEQILGPDYWPVLQQLRDDGFDPNGKIFWEQNEIDITELLIIMGKITRGEAEVKSVEIY